MPTRIVLRTTSLPSKASNSSTSSDVNHDGISPVQMATSAHGCRDVKKSKKKQDPSKCPSIEYVSTPPRSNTTASLLTAQKQQAPRSVLNFRSSILREQLESTSDPSKLGVDDYTGLPQQAASSTHQQGRFLTAQSPAPGTSPKVRLSKDDIRASPRLTGYLFTMIAAAVLLTSVVK
jgi:hypothetical protein